MATPHQSLKGQLLLDNGKLQGSFFQRTVVLICQHDAEGAFGLVLNRVTNTNVGEAIVANLPSTIKEEPLYLGGPVQPQALSYLHTGVHIPDANVLPNLNLGHSLDSLIEISDTFSPAEKVKVFAGYAGWGPGQLDEELKRESWMIHPASIEIIFAVKPKQLWKRILQEKGDWRSRLLAQGPEDLSWN